MRNQLHVALLGVLAACSIDSSKDAYTSAAGTTAGTTTPSPPPPPVDLTPEELFSPGRLSLRANSVQAVVGGPTPAFTNMHGAIGRFVTSESNSVVAITYAAQMKGTGGGMVSVRAMVDGIRAQPGEVLFANMNTHENVELQRSFVFLIYVAPGVHTVQMQWLASGGRHTLSGQILRVEHANVFDDRVRGLSDNKDFRIASNRFAAVPGMSGWVRTEAGQALAATFSSMNYAINDLLEVRARVDGREIGAFLPTGTELENARTWLFAANDVPAGFHWVEIEARVRQQTGVGVIRHRSLLLRAVGSSLPRASAGLVVGRQPEVVGGAGWRIAQSQRLMVPPNADVVATLDIDWIREGGGGDFEFQLVVDQVLVGPVMRYSRTFPLNDGKGSLAGVTLGTTAFHFGAKHVNLGRTTKLVSIEVRFRITGNGQGSLVPSTFLVESEVTEVPDLMENLSFGISRRGYDFAHPVEPISGSYPLYLIPYVSEAAADEAPAVVDVQRAVMIGDKSVRRYFDEVSSGRFTITAAITDWHVLTEDEADYKQFDADGGCADGLEHVSAGRAKWIEALRAVAATDDLSRFDANRDRRLDTDELAIVFVGIGGKVSGAVRALATCDGPLVIDGLEFTDAAGWTLENGALDSTAVLTHELGHLFLRLDDMYTNTITTPMEYSLMDQHSNFPQMDGYSRFALGWATHSTLVRPGAVTLRATTERADVLVLPQLESPAEFFLLEYRRRGATLFDAAIPETGVAVWHIIDDELRDFEPNCADDDWGYHVTYDDDGNEISRSDWNKSRKGIRLVRPRVELRTGDTPRWRAGFEVWVPSFGPILDQEPAAICPDPGEFNARGFLSWADYRPSGYSVAWLDAGGGRNVGMNIQRRW